MNGVNNVPDALRFGGDQPERFLTAWYGPPQRPMEPTPVQSPVPAALSSWWRQVKRWDDAAPVQNRVPAGDERDGDTLLVGVENQGVWLWGVRDVGHNPLVLERENEPGAPWTLTGEHLDEYLWHFLLVEAVLGAKHALGAANLTRDDVATFLTGWQRVPAKSWRWPGPEHTLWSNDECLALTSVNEPPDTLAGHDAFLSVYAASRNAVGLTRLDRHGIAWDWDASTP